MVLSLLMVLVGFILAMLGIITFMHSEHQVIAILLFFGGICSIFEGLPKRGGLNG